MTTEKRLIDANALLSKFKEHRDLYAPSWEAFKVSSINVKSRVDEIDTCMADVINAPTVDAVEVVHGHWISDEADVLFHCSVCDTQISTSWDYDDLHWNYCPNCGAKMDGDGNG